MEFGQAEHSLKRAQFSKLTQTRAYGLAMKMRRIPNAGECSEDQARQWAPPNFQKLYKQVNWNRWCVIVDGVQRYRGFLVDAFWPGLRELL
jgi:hypothetical protein